MTLMGLKRLNCCQGKVTNREYSQPPKASDKIKILRESNNDTKQELAAINEGNKRHFIPSYILSQTFLKVKDL